MNTDRNCPLIQAAAVAALFAATALVGLHMAGSFLDGFLSRAFWAF